MRRTWFVLLCLALIACSNDPTGPGAPLALQVEDAQTTVESAVVESARGAAVVRGVYVAPNSGYTLRAEYTRDGDGVTLSIQGVAPGASFAVISGHEYRATLPLPAGTHTVRVIHETANGLRYQVARQQVTVS